MGLSCYILCQFDEAMFRISLPYGDIDQFIEIITRMAKSIICASFILYSYANGPIFSRNGSSVILYLIMIGGEGPDLDSSIH